MDRNWKLLAEHAARRRAELGLSQIEVAQRGPLSLDRVQAIEGAKSTRFRLGTLLALERALAWEAGSVEAILAGGDPTVRETRVEVGRVTSRGEARPARSPMDRAEEIMDENERLVQLAVERIRRLNRKKRAAVVQLLDALEDDPPEDADQQ